MDIRLWVNGNSPGMFSENSNEVCHPSLLYLGNDILEFLNQKEILYNCLL